MGTTTAAIEAVWRIESGRLVAVLARITGDFAAAEDLAQDALEVALRQWPHDGIPRHPASWLIATTRHLPVDRYRREANLHRKLGLLAQQTETRTREDTMSTVDERLDSPVHDDLLRLIFTACHPALTAYTQVALILRTLGGLRTGEIARAFLVSEATASSTRGTPPPPATTGPDLRSAPTPSGSAGSSPVCNPTMPRCTAWSR